MRANLSFAPDAAELASIVLTLASDDKLRMEQMELLGRIAREHSAMNMVAKTEAEYQSLLQ
jgi:hypothetical protein